MLRLTLKGVRGHLGRFLLTALAVMLGTAFVAGTFVLTDSIERTFSQIFSAGAAGTDVVVRGALPEGADDGGGGGPFAAGRPPLPAALADDLAGADGVARASADITGSALLVGADGTAVRGGGQAPAFGFAYREDDPALTVVDGRGPTAADEIAVESDTLERSGLALGDTTQVVVGPAPREVEVVGEVGFDAGLAGATVVVLDEASATALFSPDGTVASLTLTAEPGTTQEQLRDAVEPVLPEGAEAITGADSTAEQQEALAQALGFVNTFLLIFAAVALFVGGFIIANTFSMLVAQRTRELALLRALGAARNQVLASVLGEAVVVGLLGGALGLGLGLALAAGIAALLGATTGFEVSGGLPVLPRTVLAALTVGVVVTLVSAVPPALRASRIAPVAAMRDDIALPEHSERRRVLTAAVLAAAAVGLGAAGINGVGGGLMIGGAALAGVLATVAAAPFLARPIVRVLAAPAVALPGVVGRLARENVLRNPRRTASTASALMVGLALVAAVSVLSSSASASVEDLIGDDLRSDFVLTAGGQTPFATTVAEQAADLDGVASVAAVASLPVTVGEAQEFAAAVDVADLADNVAVEVLDGDLADVGSKAIALTEGTADDAGLAVGDTASITAGTLTAREVEVAAIFSDSNPLGAGALVGPALYDEAVPPAQRAVTAVFVTAEEGTDPGDLREALTDVAAPFVVVSVLDREEYTSEQTAQIDQLLGIIYALLALSVVIAVVGIVNTLALSVVERTREIGLLRAVGLTRGQLRRMITVESVCTAVFGAVLGTALGLAFGLAMQRVLAGQGLEVLSVPVTTLVGIVVVAGLVGVVAAVLPALRASRMDVLRALAAN